MTSLLSDVRIGAQRPRWHHLPAAIVSSAGSEAVDLAAGAGLILDDWQRWCLEHSCAERADGTWAAFEAALIVGRQNGKNAILEARELAGVVLFGDDLIVHSAHRADTTLEHFRRMCTLAEEFDEFGKLVKRISHVNGHEAIELKGGRRLKFVSRARQPGRGLSGSVVVLDEAFDLAPEAIGAMIPTLATRTMAQVWYTSSAPKASSLVLHGVRRRGLTGEDAERLFFAEWGNEPGTTMDDIDAAYAANPGLGIRISLDYVLAERELMAGTPEEYLRERLGVAEDPASSVAAGPIAPARWAELAAGDDVDMVSKVLALDVNPEMRWASLGAAGRAPDGRYYVDVVTRKPGTAWVLDEVVRVTQLLGVPVRVAPSSPAGSFIARLRELGVEVVEVSEREHAQACGALLEAVTTGSLCHGGQLSLTEAVAAARQRPTGDAWLWSRVRSSADISALVSVTLALGGVPEPSDAHDGSFLDLDDY